jgi:hypothetical protein
MNTEEDEFKRIEAEAKRRAAFQRKVDDDMRIAFEAKWDDDDTQVYKKPWVGLTDEEFDTAINSNLTITDSRLRDGVYGVALDIAALLKEKNT